MDTEKFIKDCEELEVINIKIVKLKADRDIKTFAIMKEHGFTDYRKFEAEFNKVIK